MVHNSAERAVIKLMHVKLHSCTMNDADTVKFFVMLLQSQNCQFRSANWAVCDSCQLRCPHTQHKAFTHSSL